MPSSICVHMQELVQLSEVKGSPSHGMRGFQAAKWHAVLHQIFHLLKSYLQLSMLHLCLSFAEN